MATYLIEKEKTQVFGIFRYLNSASGVQMTDEEILEKFEAWCKPTKTYTENGDFYNETALEEAYLAGWKACEKNERQKPALCPPEMDELQMLRGIYREFKDTGYTGMRKQLAAAEAVIDFYASDRNWSPRTDNETCYNRILNFDLSKHEYACGDLFYTIGGKRAREYQREYKRERDE